MCSTGRVLLCCFAVWGISVMWGWWMIALWYLHSESAALLHRVVHWNKWNYLWEKRWAAQSGVSWNCVVFPPEKGNNFDETFILYKMKCIWKLKLCQGKSRFDLVYFKVGLRCTEPVFLQPRSVSWLEQSRVSFIFICFVKVEGIWFTLKF